MVTFWVNSSVVQSSLAGHLRQKSLRLPSKSCLRSSCIFSSAKIFSIELSERFPTGGCQQHGWRSPLALHKTKLQGSKQFFVLVIMIQWSAAS